jgi:pyridoxine 5-phosphate synthase
VSATSNLRLGVNVDHVATIRNARGGRHPDPVRAAKLAIEAGADGITAHLREDRRHIRDDDMARLKAEIAKPLNFEMAATNEMVAIASRTKPHAVCLVPERREERTTEGGLDGARLAKRLGLEVHAGHGLNFATAETIAALPEIVELNIGHFLIGEAVYSSLADVVRTMRAAMERGRARIQP